MLPAHPESVIRVGPRWSRASWTTKSPVFTDDSEAPSAFEAEKSASAAASGVSFPPIPAPPVPRIPTPPAATCRPAGGLARTPVACHL